MTVESFFEQMNLKNKILSLFVQAYRNQREVLYMEMSRNNDRKGKNTTDTEMSRDNDQNN